MQRTNPQNRTQQLQRIGFCLLGRCWGIRFGRYETTRNQDQLKTRRDVRRHNKLHPNENQLRNSEKPCFLLEGMLRLQASCSQCIFIHTYIHTYIYIYTYRCIPLHLLFIFVTWPSIHCLEGNNFECSIRLSATHHPLFSYLQPSFSDGAHSPWVFF